MGLRFRRSIKLAPGLRLNLSKSGLGMSVGARGASISVGSSGVYANAGIPGTGFSIREKISGTSAQSSNTRSSTTVDPRTVRQEFETKLVFNDEGQISFQDSNGNPLNEAFVSKLKKQNVDLIRSSMQTVCNEQNEKIEGLAKIHEATPTPLRFPEIIKTEYEVEAPVAPVQKPIGLLARLFAPLKKKAEAQNRALEQAFESIFEDWKKNKAAFEKKQCAKVNICVRAQNGDVNAMEEFLQDRLSLINWPQETNISFDINPDGQHIFVDVDLPEIESIPTRCYEPNKRQLQLKVKNLSSTAIQKTYMTHVHGVGFRVIGECFASLPTLTRVIISAYTQRVDASSGNLEDDYLYSVRVERKDWELINFENLRMLDVVKALEQFDLRRDMTTTGRFKPIQPFAS